MDLEDFELKASLPEDSYYQFVVKIVGGNRFVMLTTCDKIIRVCNIQSLYWSFC